MIVEEQDAQVVVVMTVLMTVQLHVKVVEQVRHQYGRLNQFLIYLNKGAWSY